MSNKRNEWESDGESESESETEGNDECRWDWYCDDCGRLIPTGRDECPCWRDSHPWKCDDCGRGLYDDDDECPCWNAPEPPMNAYRMFMDIRKKILIRKNPTWTPLLVKRKAGEKWKSLSVEKKRRYETLAVDDKRRYDREMRIYIKKLKAFDNRDPKTKSVERPKTKSVERPKTKSVERPKIVITHRISPTEPKEPIVVTHQFDEDDLSLGESSIPSLPVIQPLVEDDDEKNIDDEDEDEDDEDDGTFDCHYCHETLPTAEIALSVQEIEEDCDDDMLFVCNKCVD